MLACKKIDLIYVCRDQYYRQLDVACGGADLRATVPCARLVYATPPMGKLARIYNQFPSNVVITITTKFERPLKLTFLQQCNPRPDWRFQRAAVGARLIKWLHANSIFWIAHRSR